MLVGVTFSLCLSHIVMFSIDSLGFLLSHRYAAYFAHGCVRLVVCAGDTSCGTFSLGSFHFHPSLRSRGLLFQILVSKMVRLKLWELVLRGYGRIRNLLASHCVLI